MSARPGRKRYEAVALKEWPSGKSAEQVRSELQAEGCGVCPVRAEERAADAGAPAPAPPPPSLVTYGQSQASSPCPSRRAEWTRQQRRVFQRLTSWCFEAVGRGAALVRVDLTTAPGGDAGSLRKHLQELRRRVERHWKFPHVELFVVETTEGNGVLHMVWAWVGDRSFYIPQDWLSEEWEKIHGAPVVWVRKMRIDRKDIKCVGRYFALQYLSDQRGALVRMSWSWWRSRVALARGWERLKAEFRKRCEVATWTGCNPEMEAVTFADVLNAWESLLRDGAGTLGETLFEVRDRNVVEVF